MVLDFAVASIRLGDLLGLVLRIFAGYRSGQFNSFIRYLRRYVRAGQGRILLQSGLNRALNIGWAAASGCITLR